MNRTASYSGPVWVLALLIWGALGLLSPTPAPAASKASAQFAKAEREFTNLKRKKALQRYRHNYTKIESRLRKVFDGYPKSTEAEKALLRAGELMTLLYRWTSSKDDLNQSRAYYRRLIKGYPKSSRVDDAQVAIALLYLNYYNDPAQAYLEFEKVSRLSPRGNQVGEAARWMKKLRRHRPAKTVASVSGPGSAFAAAEKKYARLKKKASLQRYRHNYTSVLDRYRRVFEKYPGSDEAPKALRRAGELYTLLYRWTSSKSDLERAKHYYQRLVRDYPSASLVDDAQIAIAYLYLDKYKEPTRAYEEFQKVSQVAPRGDRKAEADRNLKKLIRYRPAENKAPPPASPVPAVLARVTGIRSWSNPQYTRVVIDIDQRINFYSNLLKESSSQKKPPRLYIDLFNTLVESRLRTPIPVNDGILLTIRAGQFTPDTVRVVLDIDQLKTYNIFPMENPFRLVIDATGGGKKSLPVASAIPPGDKDPGGKLSLARQLGLGIRRVVIDAGHGAHDPGAVGIDGIKEKDITLDLALRLKDLLLQEGLEVILTRNRDVFLNLEERTAIANTSHGDLFVSLHANSSKKARLRGVETYFLNLASSQRAMETAAIENSMAVAKMSDLEDIVKEIFNSKMDESSRLAEIVQASMVQVLRRHYRDIRDLGVKQAPFYVLIGAEMPSILAEVSFINHPVEGKRLATSSYRQHLAESLADGIRGYIRSVKLASAAR